MGSIFSSPEPAPLPAEPSEEAPSEAAKRERRRIAGNRVPTLLASANAETGAPALQQTKSLLGS
ncbi:MAG: hypothetical protein K2Q12_08015 [Rickettsiales bacterium]|nr:hypothetical protein [Rickettsiales bacterium]